MSYTKDKLWQLAKARFKGTEKANNWVYIITYYNHIGGNTLSLFCTPEEMRPCRVLCKLDNKNKVLTKDEHSRYRFYTVEELLESPKVFSYEDEPMTKVKRHWFKDDSVYGKKTFYYYELGGVANE